MPVKIFREQRRSSLFWPAHFDVGADIECQQIFTDHERAGIIYPGRKAMIFREFFTRDTSAGKLKPEKNLTITRK